MSGNDGNSSATFLNTNGSGTTSSASWTSNQGSKDVGFSVTSAAAVPEPSSYGVLFGLVALGVMTTRRRRLS